MEDDAPSQSAGIDGPLRRGQIIILALAGAVLLYVVVAVAITIAGDFDGPLGDDDSTLWIMRGALAVVAVINFSTASFLIRSLAASPGEAPIEAKLLAATVIGGAFAEAVAIYGLVLTLLGGHAWDVVAFGVVALLALAALFPRRAAWEARSRADALRTA